MPSCSSAARNPASGKQNGSVKQLNVNEGGQAIVNIHHGGGVKEKTNINPMHLAPRCHARSKRTGKPCQAPAVKGRNVCRMHGAHGGAPSGKANGNYRHGNRTQEAMEANAAVRVLTRLCRQTIDALPHG